MKAKAAVEDAERMHPYLGYRPLNVVRHALENTTQLASQLLRIPLHRHVMPMVWFINRTRSHETIATDTMVLLWKDLSGPWCA
jgi:hypothetical protein